MILSIIIPVYNVEKYIRKTLDSIFHQQFNPDDVEIIIVNDGSPDDSMKIVDEYKVKHSNLVIINQTNQGLSAARNTGLEVSRGDYVWFVDSDDWIEDGCLQRVLNELYKSSYDLLVYLIREYDEAGNIIRQRAFPSTLKSKTRGIDFLKCYSFDRVPMQMYIIRRCFLISKDLRFRVGITHEDIEFAPRMLIAASSVKAISEVSYCYLRRQSGNITADRFFSDKRVKDFTTIINEYSRLFSVSNRSEIQLCYLRVAKESILRLFHSVPASCIRDNQGVFSKKYIVKCKSIVFKSLILEDSIKHLVRDIIFLFSPYLYNKIINK